MFELCELISLLPVANEVQSLTTEEPEAEYILLTACKNLRTIIEHHGKVNHFINNTESEESFYLIRSLSDRMWERINIGHFSEVPLQVRRIYSLANLYKIIYLLLESQEQKQIEKCFEVLDKAIIIGSSQDLFEKSDEFISRISTFLSNALGQGVPTELPEIDPVVYNANAECDIPSCACPSVEYFKNHHFDLKKPLLIKDSITHWPAKTKWRNPNYLLKVAGNRTLPIEIGSTYTTEDWTQDLVKLKDFLLRQFGSENCASGVEYLAQHELFDQIPELKNDIKVPDYCCLTSSTEKPDINIKAWLGPKGTVSPMHQDPKHNILCQVFGVKKIILASFDDTPHLYPFESNFLNNTSQIDAENIDFTKYPLAKEAKFYHLLLQEGDCVYIPPKWWHFVKSLSKSFSVSFWWE